MSDLFPDPDIRSVQEKELPELHRLDNEIFEFSPYPYFVLRQHFDAHGDHLLVLDDGKALQGYMLAATPPATGPTWLLSLGVARDQRGRGLGRRLMVEMLSRLRSEGVREFRLAVDPENERAVRLYTSLGFTPLGDPHEDYFGPNQDRLLMALSLPAPVNRRGEPRRPGPG